MSSELQKAYEERLVLISQKKILYDEIARLAKLYPKEQNARPTRICDESLAKLQIQHSHVVTKLDINKDLIIELRD